MNSSSRIKASAHKTTPVLRLAPCVRCPSRTPARNQNDCDRDLSRKGNIIWTMPKRNSRFSRASAMHLSKSKILVASRDFFFMVSLCQRSRSRSRAQHSVRNTRLGTDLVCGSGGAEAGASRCYPGVGSSLDRLSSDENSDRLSSDGHSHWLGCWNWVVGSCLDNETGLGLKTQARLQRPVE